MIKWTNKRVVARKTRKTKKKHELASLFDERVQPLYSWYSDSRADDGETGRRVRRPTTAIIGEKKKAANDLLSFIYYFSAWDFYSCLSHRMDYLMEQQVLVVLLATLSLNKSSVLNVFWTNDVRVSSYVHSES